MRKSLRLLTSLLISVGSLVAPFVGSTVAHAQTTQRIFYLDGNYNLVSMNPDGSDPHTLAQYVYPNFQLSPDGTELAFAKDTPNVTDLFIMNVDGSGLRDLTNLPSNEWTDNIVSWSPDGTKIAYGVGGSAGEDIYTVNADGSDNTNLTNNPKLRNSRPLWSPDGNHILFNRVDGSIEDAYVMNADGINSQEVVQDTIAESWSPDSSKIAFVHDVSYQVGITNVDGSNAVLLSYRKLAENPEATSEEAPVWSPDGSRLAFQSSPYCISPCTATPGLVTVDSSGDNPVSVYAGEADDPAWSPDSNFLIFSQQGSYGSQPWDSGYELFTVPASGGSPTQTTFTSDAAFFPAWFSVNPPAPVVSVGSISAPSTSAKNAAVSGGASFTDTVAESPYSASWNWGDGNTSAGTVTSTGTSGSVSDMHTYTTAGSYKITLTVTDSSGATSTSSFVIAVSPGSNFQNAHISGLNYDNSNLSNQDLSNAQAQSASFQEVDFAGANLSNAQMQYANLTAANLSGANLQNIQLQYANMTNTNLSGAYAHNAHFDNAVILGAIWSDTICPDNTNSDNDGMTCVGHGV